MEAFGHEFDSLYQHFFDRVYESIAPDLFSAIYLTGVVCKLLRQPEGLPSAHLKDRGCGFLRHKK